ncbi:MAG: hypothetical protein QNJ35_14215 [Paracoccaceae bacterium]|nr:hypothetical protein [Paracoccaceae bacterium]
MSDPNHHTWITAETSAGRLSVDPGIGNIRHLSFVSGDRQIEPLHTAPWVEDPEILSDAGILPVERRLSGDFFCAPFGASDLEDAPAHGWPANSAWNVGRAGAGSISLTLAREVMGAKIVKTLRLARDAPLLYQEHTISGGSGGLTLAHHPMIRLGGRGRLSCSTKCAVLTADQPLEPGRHRLAIGARSEGLAHVPGTDGSDIDLTDLPIGDRHEDFATLVEAPGAVLGWTAVVREAEDDVVFVLKDPCVLPVTMLWHSNAGRDYAPWNGRHHGVLGIEDGCAAGSAGHRAALGPNPIADEGVPTALQLAPDQSHRVAHVIGVIPRPDGWSSVRSITVSGGILFIEGDHGASVELPFVSGFFPETI